MSQDPKSPTTSDPAKAAGLAQAEALKAQARGLRSDAYLPPCLAEWMLDLIARGDFSDPSEAVFVMLTDQHELEPHADLRRELLARSIRAAVDEYDRAPDACPKAPGSQPGHLRGAYPRPAAGTSSADASLQ